MQVALVAAMDEQGVIGRDNRLPWHLPDDLRHFKKLTMGCPVVMGRRTWESIGRPLPGRLNIVLTRRPGYQAGGCSVASDLPGALRQAEQAGADKMFIIGGSAVYEAAIPTADEFYLTRVHACVDGDARFPPWDPCAWVEVSRERHPADGDHAYAFSLVHYRRAVSPSRQGE